jgi:hypothetical protein
MRIALFTSNEDRLYAYVQYQLDEGNGKLIYNPVVRCSNKQEKRTGDNLEL